MLPTIYLLVATLFIASDDGSLARANVEILDSGLTAEDCIEALEEIGPSPEGGPVYSCVIAIDF